MNPAKYNETKRLEHVSECERATCCSSELRTMSYGTFLLYGKQCRTNLCANHALLIRTANFRSRLNATGIIPYSESD